MTTVSLVEETVSPLSSLDTKLSRELGETKNNSGGLSELSNIVDTLSQIEEDQQEQ